MRSCFVIATLAMLPVLVVVAVLVVGAAIVHRFLNLPEGFSN